MTVALITGVSGFCGRHLVARLRSESGVRVVGANRAGEPPPDVRLDDYVTVDVTDYRRVTDLVRSVRPDWMFHLAGSATEPAHTMYQTNVMGVVWLLEAIRAVSAQTATVIVGSAAEYGSVSRAAQPVSEDHPCRPVGPYAVSKHAATLAALDTARCHGLKVLVARPFNIVGPGIPRTLVVGAVLERARQTLREAGEPVVRVGGLDAERDFVAVDDVVEAYVRMARCGRSGEVFNLCSGVPSRIRDVAERLLSYMPRPMRLQCDPRLLRAGEVSALYGSYERARRAFGWEPRVPLEEALRAAWTYAFEGV